GLARPVGGFSPGRTQRHLYRNVSIRSFTSSGARLIPFRALSLPIAFGSPRLLQERVHPDLPPPLARQTTGRDRGAPREAYSACAASAAATASSGETARPWSRRTSPKASR